MSAQTLRYSLYCIFISMDTHDFVRVQLQCSTTAHKEIPIAQRTCGAWAYSWTELCTGVYSLQSQLFVKLIMAIPLRQEARVARMQFTEKNIILYCNDGTTNDGVIVLR